MCYIILQIKNLFINLLKNSFANFEAKVFNGISSNEQKKSYLKENLDGFNIYLRGLDFSSNGKINLRNDIFVTNEDKRALRKIFSMINLRYSNEVMINEIYSKVSEYLSHRQEARSETQRQSKDLQQEIGFHPISTVSKKTKSQEETSKEPSQEIVEEKQELNYNQARKEFNDLSLIDRKRLQEKIKTKADGVFGQNTFRKLKQYININYPNGKIPSFFSIINNYSQTTQTLEEDGKKDEVTEQNPLIQQAREIQSSQPQTRTIKSSNFEIDVGPFGYGVVRSINRSNNLQTKSDNSEQNQDNLGTKFEANEMSPGIKLLLDFIGKAEGTYGNYNAIYGNGKQDKIKFTQMSLREVLAYQRKHARRTGSSAIGKYQIMQYTLSGLIRENNIDMNQKFSEELQDKLAIKLLERRGLRRFQSGRLSLRGFVWNLSMEWASLPKNNGGKSYHHGDKMGNRALVSYNEVSSVVNLLRNNDRLS